MSTITRVTQADAQVGLANIVARVSDLDGTAALDIATTIRITQCTLQVALAYVVPRVTQVNAQAAVSMIVPTRTSAYINIL